MGFHVRVFKTGPDFLDDDTGAGLPNQVRHRPGWDHISAVQNHQLFEIRSCDALQPGPTALTDGLLRLKTIIDNWSKTFG